MNVRNCKKCGKIFNYISGLPICPTCKERTEAKFQEVKKFVQQNKQAGVNEIAEECDVEINQIHQWIREERLFFAEDSPIGINCENCGTTIKTGRYCERCKAEMARTLTSSMHRREPLPEKKQLDTRTNPKMRFLDRQE